MYLCYCIFHYNFLIYSKLHRFSGLKFRTKFISHPRGIRPNVYCQTNVHSSIKFNAADRFEPSGTTHAIYCFEPIAIPVVSRWTEVLFLVWYIIVLRYRQRIWKFNLPSSCRNFSRQIQNTLTSGLSSQCAILLLLWYFSLRFPATNDRICLKW